MFKPLTKEEIKEIVKIIFSQVQNLLQKNNIVLEPTENAIQILADMGYDPLLGARPLKRLIQTKVLNELSKMILSGTISKEKTIVFDISDEKFIFYDKKE